MRKRMMQLAGQAKVDYMKNFSDYMSKKMGIKTVPTATPVQDTPVMSQEDIDKALLDIQNMPVNDTQYFQTGFERDATGQNQAIPYDANNATYEEAEKAEEFTSTNPMLPKPEKSPEKPKNNPFLMLRGLSTAASFISNMVARRAQDKYDYLQQTALGQMNPMSVNQFQPTYNNVYGEKGGNPFSTYAKYGGNLKTIMKEYGKWSNDAGPMDMTYGKGNKYLQAGGTIPNAGGPADLLSEYETAKYSLENAKKLKLNEKGDFKALIPMEYWTDDMMDYINKLKFVNKKKEPYIKVRGKLPTPEGKHVMPDGTLMENSQMAKGGMNIPEMYTQNMVRKLLYIGRFAHPYRGKKMGGKLEKDECNHCMETDIKLEKGGFSLKASKWRKGGSLTPNKARMILHDGTAHGKPLTDKQRRYFGAMSKGHTNFRGK